MVGTTLVRSTLVRFPVEAEFWPFLFLPVVPVPPEPVPPVPPAPVPPVGWPWPPSFPPASAAESVLSSGVGPNSSWIWFKNFCSSEPSSWLAHWVTSAAGTSGKRSLRAFIKFNLGGPGSASIKSGGHSVASAVCPGIWIVPAMCPAASDCT